MTPRERVLAVLERREVDRLPVDLWYTPEVGAALQSHFGVNDDFALWAALGLDKVVWVFMDYRFAEGQSASAQVGAGAAGHTMWGVPLKGMTAGAAHYEEFADAPLQDYDTPAALDEYPWWPDPARVDYAQAARKASRAARDYAVIGPWVSCFEIYCQLRGLEQAMMDLALAPAMVEAILDRVEAIQTDMLHRFLQATRGSVDLVFISDDLGGQNGLLISPRDWRRHLQPRLRRWCELIHGYGLKVLFHTDGGVEPLIGPLLDCGVDVLNPIQHRCPGMDRRRLKEAYGERVIFHGGVDNQHALPFGTPAEVRAETQRCLETLGAGRRGYICCSCHNVQAGTPVENVLAMVETVRAG